MGAMALLVLLAAGCEGPAPASPDPAGAKKGEAAQTKAAAEAVAELGSCKRKVTALEAELSRLERQTKGEAPAAAYRIINSHEHLMSLENLERYLPVARAAGIVSTVMVASPRFTLLGKGTEKGEPSMAANFEVLLEAAKRYPGEIIPFAGIDPADPEKLERLKRHVELGAKGAKLYSGHSSFYEKPLNDPGMEPVLAYLEQTGLPLCWHINLLQYMDEFAAVMQAHPRLNVQVPHYGVTFWKPDGIHLKKLREMLRTYPNLYIDTSLGTRQILVDGIGVMSKHTKIFVDLIKEFPERVHFGTDGVVTGNPEKNPDWWEKVIMVSRNQLERDSFNFPMGAGYSRYFHKGLDPSGNYRGLALPADILKKIYEDNPQHWLAGPRDKG